MYNPFSTTKDTDEFVYLFSSPEANTDEGRKRLQKLVVKISVKSLAPYMLIGVAAGVAATIALSVKNEENEEDEDFDSQEEID